MDEYLQTVRLGDATVTLINIGYFRDPNVSPEEGAKNPSAGLPSYCGLIELPDAVILVDAGHYDLSPDSPFYIPRYQPPPGLIARLADRGIRTDQVTQVIITHIHWDHIDGLTVERDGAYQPAFPNARYYLGQADWDNPDTQAELQKPESLVSHTLGVLHRADLLELVSGDLKLSDNITIVAAPGESPGHQIVKLASQGQVMYILGDLYHDTESFAQPDHMDWWANRENMLASRAALVKAALAENALLTVAHIGTVGRLQPADTASGARWVTA